MKAMTRQELADCAGVSVRTLNGWCQPFREELQRRGLRPHMKVLPPRVVAYLAEQLCIDVHQ